MYKHSNVFVHKRFWPLSGSELQDSRVWQTCSIFISCDVGLRGSLMVTKSIRVETHWHNNQKMPCSTQKYTHKSQPHLCILSFTCFHMWCICQDRKFFIILNDWWPKESVFYLILLSLSLSLVCINPLKPFTWEAPVQPLGNKNWSKSEKGSGKQQQTQCLSIQAQ